MSRIQEVINQRPMRVDGVLAGTICVLSLLNLWIVWPVAQPAPPVSVPAAIVLTLLLILPLTWRRRFPLVVLASTTVVFVLSSVAGVPGSLWGGNAWGLALYSAGAHGGERWRNPVRAAAIVGFLAVIAFHLLWSDSGGYAGSPMPLRIVPVLSNFAITAAIFWFGDTVRIGREREAQLAERTAQLEREREMNARRAVIDERVRIARELHDVVAHHVSLMGVQAGAARRVLHQQPEKAAEVLTTIEATGRQAVRELHRLLGFLRREEDDGLAPQPGMSQLDGLVAQMREAGLPVALMIAGEVRPLPPGVDLSAYRIVQEALTNTLKHAGSATAAVTVRYRDDALDIDVTDDGQRPPMPGAANGGNGMIGMRERVALLRGQLRVGPRPGGGFVVHAHLPLDEQPA